jgi:predicted metalloprotease with PDZ domain
MVGADSILTYRIDPMPPDRFTMLRTQGGQIQSSVEMRVIHVESGTTVFRQTATATTTLPNPTSGLVWPRESIELAYKAVTLQAGSYAFAALVAAFGENPLGVVPNLDKREGGVELLGVLDGGPAHVAGIRQGDRITAIGGRTLRVWTERMTLPVTLTILREGNQQEVVVSSLRGS